MSSRLAIAIAAFMLAKFAHGQEAIATPDLHCISATFSTKTAKNKNKVTLCRGPDYATQQIYFPNRPLYQPTTCNAVGTAVDSDSLTTTYRFERGTCENGEILRPAEYVCKSSGSKTTCVHKGVELEFSEIEQRP